MAITFTPGNMPLPDDAEKVKDTAVRLREISNKVDPTGWTIWAPSAGYAALVAGAGALPALRYKILPDSVQLDGFLFFSGAAPALGAASRITPSIPAALTGFVPANVAAEWWEARPLVVSTAAATFPQFTLLVQPGGLFLVNNSATVRTNFGVNFRGIVLPRVAN